MPLKTVSAGAPLEVQTKLSMKDQRYKQAFDPLRIRVKQHIEDFSPIGAEKSLLDSGGFRVVVLGTYPNPKL